MTSTGATFPSGSAFLADVRARVDAYFGEKKLARTADAAMKWKSVFWLVLMAAVVAVSILGVVPFPFSLAVSAAAGFCLACVGFNVGHDAIHGSYSRSDVVNHTLSRTFDVMGASSLTWQVAHNQLHHTFTNIAHIDTDIEPGPWLRFSPLNDPPRFVHRFQHLYAWILYGLTAIAWVFVKDFGQLYKQRARPKKIVDVVSWKLAHFALFLGVPLFLGHSPAWVVLVSYAVMMAVTGVTLAVVFQLAHVVEGTAFVEAPRDGRMPEPWAEHEMRTTADFGSSRLTTFITGGLDHQIEHHLFPRICHTHYRALAPIVAACARAHGLPYLHNETFAAALASHARLLMRLGAPAQLRRHAQSA